MRAVPTRIGWLPHARGVRQRHGGGHRVDCWAGGSGLIEIVK